MGTPSRWTIQTVAPMDSYVAKSGSVILLGDAVSHHSYSVEQ